MKNLENNELTEEKKKEVIEITKSLDSLDQIEKMVNAQRKLLKGMLGIASEEIPVAQEVIKAIDNYISDKNIVYRKDDDESNEITTVLKIVNDDNNSAAVIRITNMDWI